MNLTLAMSISVTYVHRNLIWPAYKLNELNHEWRVQSLAQSNVGNEIRVAAYSDLYMLVRTPSGSC
jgi:hypothetical protein